MNIDFSSYCGLVLNTNFLHWHCHRHEQSQIREETIILEIIYVAPTTTMMMVSTFKLQTFKL